MDLQSKVQKLEQSFTEAQKIYFSAVERDFTIKRIVISKDGQNNQQQ